MENKRVRLERSAWRLEVEKEKSITEIGGEYGYSSSNFATAFKKHLDLSPAEFHKNSEQLVEESAFSHGITLDAFENVCGQITVEYLKSFTVLYERKKGNYHNLSDEWCTFIDKYAVYHFKGFPQFLFMVYQEMFCRWLAKTESRLDDRPILDIYRKVEENGYMEIDICFPLK